MAENQTEMSLDEVLSSIKQMVVDKDPPVLELTDVISSDGTIVKVKNGQKDPKSQGELRDFLRLAQENGKDPSLFENSSSEKQRTACNRSKAEDRVESSSIRGFSADCESDSSEKRLPKHTACEDLTASANAEITVNEIVREVAAPLIKDWLSKNLPNLVREVVTEEIRKMLKQR